jgi:poly(3-hydroxybutyrate) depolymerase
MSKNTEPRIENLPNLGVRDDTITVSGFSAGAFMASHLHLIYSDIFKGCGMVSGGAFPWFLERRKTKESLNVDVDKLVEHTKRLESLEQI